MTTTTTKARIKMKCDYAGCGDTGKQAMINNLYATVCEPHFELIKESGQKIFDIEEKLSYKET